MKNLMTERSAVLHFLLKNTLSMLRVDSNDQVEIEQSYEKAPNNICYVNFWDINRAATEYKDICNNGSMNRFYVYRFKQAVNYSKQMSEITP